LLAQFKLFSCCIAFCRSAAVVIFMFWLPVCACDWIIIIGAVMGCASLWLYRSHSLMMSVILESSSLTKKLFFVDWCWTLTTHFLQFFSKFNYWKLLIIWKLKYRLKINLNWWLKRYHYRQFFVLVERYTHWWGFLTVLNLWFYKRRCFWGKRKLFFNWFHPNPIFFK